LGLYTEGEYKMNIYYKLDENKNAIPCTLNEWSDQIEKMSLNATNHIADNIVEEKRISTVFLGLNHQYMPNRKPLIFETIIFKEGDYTGIYCDRYSTWKEAEEGHQKAIQWVNSLTENK
jgi:hypothetical protein